MPAAPSRGRARIELLPDDAFCSIIEKAYTEAGILPEQQREFEDDIFYQPKYDWNTPAQFRRRAFAFKISFVSRRFRTMALSLATMWTYVSTFNMCEQELHVLLARSKQAGLLIDVHGCPRWDSQGGGGRDDDSDRGYDDDDDKGAGALGRFLDAVRAHAPRWRGLHVEHSFDGAPDFVHRWIARLEGTRFPLLEYLHLHRPEAYRRDEWEGGPASWGMPALAVLCGDGGFVPDGTSELRHLQLKYDGDGHFRLLQANLAKYAHLRSLDITLEGETLDDGSLSFDTTLLPGLLRLSFKVFTLSKAFWSLLLSIRAPRLTTLSITTTRDFSMPDLLQATNHFPSIQNLRAVNAENPEVLAPFDVAAATARLPRLGHLMLERLNVQVEPLSLTVPSFPALHTLSIRNCMNVTNGYLQALYDVLRANGHLRTFKVTHTFAPGAAETMDEDFLEALEAADPGRVKLQLFPGRSDPGGGTVVPGAEDEVATGNEEEVSGEDDEYW